MVRLHYPVTAPSRYERPAGVAAVLQHLHHCEGGVGKAAERVATTLARRPRTRTVVLLGHEHDGVPAEAWDLIDEVVEIPMVGRGASLNVAVAGSLVL